MHTHSRSRAVDRAGNSSTQAFSFVVDLTAPTLEIDTFGNQGYVSHAPITGTLSDNRRIYQTIRYSFDGGELVERAVDPGSNGTAVRFAIPTLGLMDGPHTVVIIGEDQAGNTVQSSASFIVDTHGPRVAGITPAGTVIGPHNQITITLADDRIVADKITRGTNFSLEASGGDGIFGDANSFVVPIFDEQIQYDPASRTLRIDLPAPLAEDTYRLVIRGTGTDVIRDLAGNSFNDGVDFVHRFVVLDLPAVAREPDKSTPAGTQPVDLTITDLDNDGRGDLVAVDLASGELTVALNGGRTEWRSVQTVNLGVGPIHGLAVGDFNEDGKPDLLLQGPSRVFLALGNGRGGFSLAQTIEPLGLAAPPGQGRIGVLATDVNGDGHLDAVVLAPATNEVLVLAGDGNGTLATPQAFANGGEGPTDVAAGNFVGDSSLDLAIANQITGSVTFLEGDGQGSFALRGALHCRWAIRSQHAQGGRLQQGRAR